MGELNGQEQLLSRSSPRISFRCTGDLAAHLFTGCNQLCLTIKPPILQYLHHRKGSITLGLKKDEAVLVSSS